MLSDRRRGRGPQKFSAFCLFCAFWLFIVYIPSAHMVWGVAGLGTITPASGFVLPWHRVVIGTVAGAVCYYFCTVVKMRLKDDDSLDFFGVHGVGGVLGMLMVGVFMTASLSASGETAGVSGLIEGNAQQLWIQAAGGVATVVWCGVGTWVALKIVDAMTGLRVHADQELEGVDLSMHGEAIHQ
jgi:ammonium transporter, Amt family